MRILTPAEVYLLQKMVSKLPKIKGGDEGFTITIEQENAEQWLNIFQLTLSANEEMTNTWRRSYKPNVSTRQKPTKRS